MKIALSLMTILWLASCVSPGDFCDLAFPIETDDQTLAETIVARDRGMGEDINTHNDMVYRCKK